jgi:hypothetical protein
MHWVVSQLVLDQGITVSNDLWIHVATDCPTERVLRCSPNNMTA